MRTEKEQTRLPKAAEEARVKGFERDDANYDYVLVQDKIPGVPMNARNVAWYKSQGYEIASRDAEHTGHEELTLMAIPKSVALQRRAEQAKRDNAMYGRPEDEATGQLSPDGHIAPVKAFSSGQLADDLPSLTDDERTRQQQLAIEEKVGV